MDDKYEEIVTELHSTDLKNSFKDGENGWKHSLHGTCSRLGAFPPELANYFIQRYSNEGDTVLDPFAGRGTAPLEALRLNRDAIGSDAAPDAYTLTQAKIHPFSVEEVNSRIDELEKKYDKQQEFICENEDVEIFYHENTLHQLQYLKETLTDSKLDTFISSIILGILHGKNSNYLSLPMSHSYSMSPNYVKKYAKEHNLEKPDKDVFKSIKLQSEEVLKDGLPELKGEAYHSDVLDLQLDKEVNLIITSPPYYHALTYAWDNWLRLWFLGHDYKEVRDDLIQTQDEEKYRHFMDMTMEKMYNWLSKDSYCVMVVGDVTKTITRDNEKEKKLIKTAERLVEPAINAGFEEDVFIVKDEIPSQNKTTASYVNDDEGVKRDRILVLKKGNPTQNGVIPKWAKK